MANPLQTPLPGLKSQTPGRPPDRPAAATDPIAIKAMLGEAKRLAQAGRNVEAIDRLEVVLQAGATQPQPDVACLL